MMRLGNPTDWLLTGTRMLRWCLALVVLAGLCLFFAACNGTIESGFTPGTESLPRSVAGQSRNATTTTFNPWTRPPLRWQTQRTRLPPPPPHPRSLPPRRCRPWSHWRRTQLRRRLPRQYLRHRWLPPRRLHRFLPQLLLRYRCAYRKTKPPGAAPRPPGGVRTRPGFPVTK